MIQFAKEANLLFQKNEKRKERLDRKLSQRRKNIAKFMGIDVGWSQALFDDPVMLKLFLTRYYYARIEKRSIKTMTIEMTSQHFHSPTHPLREEIFEKVMRHFEKHGVVMKVKFSDNGQTYKVSITTVGL